MFRRPTPSSERSADERARAAAERAARRAEREGRPVPPPPPETFAARSAPPPAPDALEFHEELDAHDELDGHDGHDPEEVPAYSAEDPYSGGYAPPEEPEPGPAIEQAPPAEEAPTVVEQHPAVAESPIAEPPVADPAPADPAPPVPAPDPDPPVALSGETAAFSPVDHHAAVAPAPPPAGAHDPAAVEPAPGDPLAEPTQAYTVPAAAEEPGGHTVEWIAPPPAAALPATPPAALPPRPAPAAPERGRWRRDRASATMAPTRPLSSADRGHGMRRILAVVALVAIALALYLINATFQPFHGGDGKGAVRVTVPAGADADRIGDVLAARGVVDSGRFFTLNATLTGRRGDLKPGKYTLPREMSNGAAIDALIQGPKAKVVKTFDLSIPEGRSARETASRLEETSIEGDYVRASRSAANLRRARALGLPRAATTLEGYLFPATYQLPEGTTASELVARQLDGFADNTAKVSYKGAAAKNLSRYEVLTIASMIEREVQLDRERPLVAAVIYNRLKQGIPLGIDATIRYATDNWTRPIRVSELEKDGPYNSRTRRGLPPTPIGNPGLASIRAAARPANSDVLYYVVKPGSKGAHAFSRTDAEFQRDVQRYNAARDANGGQAP